MNISENAKWTLYRDDLKIKSNKTNSTQNPIPFVITDILQNPGTNKYVLELIDEKGNVNSSIELGTFKREEETPTDTSSGGSSGSSGGGGTPEKYENIKMRYVDSEYLGNGKNITHSFNENVNGAGREIGFLNYHSNKNSGKITASIELLENVSSIILGDEDLDEVYGSIMLNVVGDVVSNINIWLGKYGFFNPQNIENAVYTQHYNKTNFSRNAVSCGDVHVYYVEKQSNGIITMEEVDSWLSDEQEKNKTSLSWNVKGPGSYVVSKEKSSGAPIMIVDEEKPIQSQTTTPTQTNPPTSIPETPTEESEAISGFGVGVGLGAIGFANRVRKKKNFSIGHHPRKNK